MADLAKSFGRRVRELRTDLSMTQSQLADAIDMSVEWVRRIEIGGASPSFDTISALAKALRVQPADLFADASPPLADRIGVAVQGLSEEQVNWLIEGARLLQQAGSDHAGARAGHSRRGRRNAVNTNRRRT